MSSAQDEAEIFAAELGADVPTIDVHGLSLHEALRDLEFFIHQTRPDGVHVVRIIHGHGTQILRNGINAWLKKHPQWISTSRESTAPGEQGAVTYAAISYKRRFH